MAIKLNLLYIPSYNVNSIILLDNSVYNEDPPVVVSPTLTVTVPSFGDVAVPFNVNTYNVLESDTLGLSETGIKQPLPDGIYYFKYTVNPAYDNYTDKSIMRVEQLQEKFDSVFMGLDFMECDKAIKTQAKVDLNTIYLLIQGSIAAGNFCASVEAYKLYAQASKLLTQFVNKGCGCSGNNYIVNFQ